MLDGGGGRSRGVRNVLRRRMRRTPATMSGGEGVAAITVTRENVGRTPGILMKWNFLRPQKVLNRRANVGVTGKIPALPALCTAQLDPNVDVTGIFLDMPGSSSVG